VYFSEYSMDWRRTMAVPFAIHTLNSVARVVEWVDARGVTLLIGLIVGALAA